MGKNRFSLKEGEDLNYCEHCFYDGESPLSDSNVVVLLNDQQSTINKQDEEIKKLKRTERSWRKIHCCNKESNNCGIVIEQQDTISRLEEEKEYWKSKAMTLLMQVRRLTPRMTDKEVIEFINELDDE